MENPVAETSLTASGASIIIVSYNSLAQTTAPCLQSIFESTDYPEFEVIVVDNNSTDGTREFLLDLSAREPRLKCILNAENRGFAGGNNDALKVAGGRFLVLLNSDTRVSRGWLAELLRPLQMDAGIGMVGPASNATGNEQEIHTVGSTPEEIEREGSLWVKGGGGEVVAMERLSFFCVATRRDVVERVGLLDEGYGLGFYEDDDYCLRVRQTGFRLVLNEDVFVYHRGSASFNQVPDTVKKLMKGNRKLLEAKFGLSRYRCKHPRERHLELIEDYLERMQREESGSAIRHRIENRLRRAELLRPRGLFKRLSFDRRLNRLKREFLRCTGCQTESL